MASTAQSTTMIEQLKQKLPLIASGKVRDIFAIDDQTLLFVASDRISAYDVIMANCIPNKGALLTRLSAHWFRLLSSAIPSLKTHFVSLELPASVAAKLTEDEREYLKDRSMVVRRLQVLPIESIVRGYITGSAWSEYQKSGTVHGIAMPAGLRESEKLERPIWTPSTKAELGAKDENIHPDKAAEIVGAEYAQQIEKLSLEIYTKARDHAAPLGIIIADTKFEFGLDTSVAPPQVVLIDEVLTPDSSRFWPADAYEVGKGQSSFDKQFLRDWLTGSGLKGKDGVEMPESVVQETAKKYKEAFERLTGSKWDA